MTHPPDGRRPTPRPVFTTPQVIRRNDSSHHVWGDDEAGFVTDRVITSTGQLHVLEFELPPGGEFRHSEMNPTVFGGDVVYAVLEGVLILANPETGEVVKAPAGTARLFQRGTWHNGFNPGRETVRVVEFFSPPPSRGTASDFARRQPALDTVRYRDERWAGRWPHAAAEQAQQTSFGAASPETALWSMRDHRASHLIATFVDTPFLTVARGEVQSGHREDFAPVTRESLLLVTEGELWVDVWSAEVGFSATSVLQPGDAMYLPAGTSQRVLVRRAEPAYYLMGSGEVPEGWRP